jgi:hypothetical protein
MPDIQDINSLKLELLKKYIIHSNLPLQSSLVGINSISNLWSLIFMHEIFPMYAEIIAAGIHPTPSEMNEIQHSDKTSPWHWLSASKAGIPFFQDLLDRNIVPTVHALSQRSEADDTNACS